MMKAPCYIGDEVAAAGFRLAGAEVRVPGDGEEAAALDAARSEASLVLVSAAIAARIAPAALRAALVAIAPPTVVVPDLAGEVPWPDPAGRLMRQLGLEG